MAPAVDLVPTDLPQAVDLAEALTLEQAVMPALLVVAVVAPVELAVLLALRMAGLASTVLAVAVVTAQASAPVLGMAAVAATLSAKAEAAEEAEAAQPVSVVMAETGAHRVVEEAQPQTLELQALPVEAVTRPS